MIVVSTGNRPRSDALPLLERLELDGMGGEIRDVEFGEDFVGRLGVVVGGAADQREAGQRNQRVDDADARPAMKNFSMAGRASSPLAKAGITRRPRASKAAITPS